MSTQNTYAQMFMAALFKKWKPICPSIDEWINKMWHNHTMKDFSAIKVNGVLRPATTCMNFENICWMKEVSYKGQQIVWFHLYEISRTGKSIKTESKQYLPEDGGRRNGDWLVVSTGFLFGVVKMLEN